MAKAQAPHAQLVSGSVFYKQPTQVNWRRLYPGYPIPLGGLIKVPQGVEAKLDVILNGQTKTLSFHSATVVRLTPDMIRRVELERYFLKTPHLDEAGDMQTVKFNFAEAWKRVAAFYDAASQWSGLHDKAVNHSDIDLGEKHKPIRLIAPRLNEAFDAPVFPAQVLVSWKEPTEPVDGYRVFVWHRSEIQPKTAPVTRFLRQYVNVPRPGEYYVQVRSRDGSWRSPSRLFVVRDIEVSRRGLASKSTNKVRSLPVAFPPQQAVFKTRAKTAPVSFSWQQQPGQWTYELTVVPAKGKAAIKKSTFDRSITVNVPLGRWHWFVTAKNKRLSLVSDKSNLAIEPLGHPRQLWTTIDQVLTSPAAQTPSVYYLP